MTLAWHFTADKLRDGRPLPAIGETLIHTGPLIPCRSGYHASERLIDALTHAPGLILWRVRLGGEIIPHGGDKLVASERTGLWKIDATDLLRSFARQCALDVADLWEMPVSVREYLETGREDMRGTAYAATYAATYAAAYDTTYAVTYAASAARAASAAYDATYAVTYAASAARDARAAAYAADAAARDAARAAARDAQNQRLTKMVHAEAVRLGYLTEDHEGEPK